MKYTRWSLKDKKTGKLVSLKEANVLYDDDSEGEEAIIFSTRDNVRSFKKFTCLKNFTPIKVTVTIREAA